MKNIILIPVVLFLSAINLLSQTSNSSTFLSNGGERRTAGIYEIYDIIGAPFVEGNQTGGGESGIYTNTTGFIYTTESSTSTECPITQTLAGTYSSNQKKAAMNQITSTNVIQSGAVVQFTASSSIKLNPTFNAQSGCTFTAKINNDPCDNSFRGRIRMLPEEPTEETIIQLRQEKIEIILYPNPSTGQFSIKILTKPMENISIEIMDLAGRPVYTQAGLKGDIFFIDLSREPSGMYLVLLRSADNIFTGKLILNN
jgi:hypothetical protein